MPSLVRWLEPQHAERADLAIIIVSLNVKELLCANLEALFRSEGTISAEVFVIDNGSQDGTQASLTAFPLVTTILNAKNLGFGGANEQGFQRANARHVLLLNPDMRIDPDSLQKTVEYLDAHPDVGVLSGRLRKEDGSVLQSVRRFPDVWSQLCILLKIPHLFPKINQHYLYADFSYEREQSVDSVRGSYFAIQERAWRTLGGLDPRYFIWFEEVDYCRQVKNRGWKVMHVPSITATDYVGRYFRQRSRIWAQWYFSQSMVKYFAKWEPWWQATLLATVRPFALLMAVGADVVQNIRSN